MTPADLERAEGPSREPIDTFIFDWFNERLPDEMAECLRAFNRAKEADDATD